MVRKRIATTGSCLILSLALLALTACGGSDEVVNLGPPGKPPEVRSTAPVSDAVPVAGTVTPMVTFSRSMNAASLTPSTFTLRTGGTTIAGTVRTQGDIATLTPLLPLVPNTLYTATVANGVRDVAGNTLQTSYSWSFTTETQAWTGVRQRGTVAADRAQGVALDSTGNVYLAGSTFGDLDGNPSAGGQDLFLLKFDLAGVPRWASQFGTSASDGANGVAVDASGNVYVAGFTLGSLPGATAGNSGGSDLFLIKYNADGTRLWVRQLGGTAADEATGVAVDAGGNIYVAGSTFGTLPRSDNASAGGEDLFLLKYDSTGVLQWVRQLGTVAGDRAYGVTVGSTGDIFVAGATLGALPGNANAGGSDIFLISYRADGARQWIRQFGTLAFDAAQAVAADTLGGIYLSGATFGGLDGGISVGGSDLFVAKFDTSGLRLWTRQLGSVGTETSLGVAAAAQGGAYATGSTTTILEGNLALGGEDMFLVKYDALGNQQWSDQFGTLSNEQGRAVAVDGGGNAYVGGGSNGDLPGIINAGGEDLFLVKYDTTGTLQ